MKKLLISLLLLTACNGSDDKETYVEVPAEEQPTPETPVNPGAGQPTEPAVVLENTYECNGGSNDGTFYTASVETYSDGDVLVYLTISSNTVFREQFEFQQGAEAGAAYKPWPSSLAEGTALTSKIRHPLTNEFSEKFGVSEDADIFVQLRRSAYVGGFYLFVGQIGDETKPEYIGLNPYGCWKASE